MPVTAADLVLAAGLKLEDRNFRMTALLDDGSLVKDDDLSKLNTAFFNMNGTISVTIFVFTLLDVLL